MDTLHLIMTNYSINPDYYMVVTRVNPVCRSWDHLPHTKGYMWIFPMRQKLLEYNRKSCVSPEEKEEINKKMYMFREVDEDEDHGYCSGSGSLDGDTYVWWDIVKKKKITKLTTKPDGTKFVDPRDALFKMIFSLHNFNPLDFAGNDGWCCGEDDLSWEFV
jgi:hypothetical protein